MDVFFQFAFVGVGIAWWLLAIGLALAERE